MKQYICPICEKPKTFQEMALVEVYDRPAAGSNVPVFTGTPVHCKQCNSKIKKLINIA